MAGEGASTPAKPSPSSSTPPPRAAALVKHRSWSPDVEREETWRRRKDIHRHRRLSRSVSVTDEDLDELQGCIDLGFSFDIDADRSGGRSPELSGLLPALDLYFGVQREYSNLSESGSSAGSSSPSSTSIYSPGDNPQKVKARLKQWAHMVACSIVRST